MVEQSFRELVFQKELDNSKEFISGDLTGLNLITLINDLIFLSASVSPILNKKVHPICVMNSIKNLISDERKYPSRILLEFAVDYLFDFEFRLDDKSILDFAVKDGIGQTVFIGDLEDACQSNNWTEAKLLIAKLYLVSDRSRAAMDVLVEIALQDVENNALFCFHLLRAYQFQEVKEDNWVYVRCLFEYLSEKRLPRPHNLKNVDINKFKSEMIYKIEPTLFSAIIRLWEGDYVRDKGYKRELSSWIKLKNNQKSESSKIISNNKNNIRNFKSYINVAENLILKNKEKHNTALDLVNLESFRSLMDKSLGKKNNFFNSRINELLI